MRGNPGVRGGICPNPQCQKKLYFPEHEASVECTGCGQRHSQSVLKNLEHSRGVTELLNVLERLLYGMNKDAVKKAGVEDSDTGRVNGLSNYLCTILSPLLTKYGMDRASGRAKLLTEMGKPPVFDCAQLGDRAFLIDPDHLSVSGYGRDRSGSSIYLQDTLNIIQSYNNGEERLVPIHADGDGHCLVHAVSRALVGWELFWHPLRVNLKQHFIDNLSKYKMQFEDFIDDSEWQLIIQECDPDFQPNGAEPTGLRNIHIFGLANVLKRPIILLDSLEGIQSPGDYSAIFLPYFSPPAVECMNKDGILNKPLCIAWSSPGRNHFISLVGVKGRKCPVLPRHMIQRSWGVNDIEIDNYVSFDENGMCQIGGEKVLQVGYFQRLVTAMSDLFLEHNDVSPLLIADVYEHIFKANGLVFGMNLNLLLDKTKTYISEGRLSICLNCWYLALAQIIHEDWLLPGGELYQLAVKCHGKLKDGQSYSFPVHDVISKYSANQDRLISERSTHGPLSCPSCDRVIFRSVQADYTIKYKNGDKTRTPSSKTSTGHKEFWNGKEYETAPKIIKVTMEWGGRVVRNTVPWFQDEEDPSLNSNVFEIAESLVEEHFPGEFGSERLVQKVVDQILIQTKKPEMDTLPTGLASSRSDIPGSSQDEDDPSTWSPHRASKAILTGLQRQSVHKEELNKSATERQIKQRIASHAPIQQRKLSDQTEQRQASPSDPGRNKTPERRIPLSTSLPQLKSQSPLSTTATAGGIMSTSAIPSERSDGNVAATSVNKRIRLSTSDGRNLTLDLPSECTFLELQSLISKTIGVEPPNQRIRHGFPPQELKAPISPEKDYKVPIQPGDKIMLDIVGMASQDPSKGLPHGASPAPSIDRSKIHGLPARREELSWTSFAEGAMDEVSDRVLQGLMDPLLASGGDSLDHSLSALALTAALENKDLWTYVQVRPHLFSVNGLFYKQAERDLGLEHGKHCQLPLLPHKLFVYNRFDDRLELCLEPYGHFPIELNVEKNASSLHPTSKCSRSSHKPFSGQGHSLRSSTTQEERMPTDIPMSPKRHEARRFNTMCDPAVHQESIEEEDEEEAAAAAAEVDKPSDQAIPKLNSHYMGSSPLSRNLPLSWGTIGAHNLLSAPESSRLVRKGPGYSELSPIPENASNERTEMLQQLVSRIEQACETMGQEAQAISEGKDISPDSLTRDAPQGKAGVTSSPGTPFLSPRGSTCSSPSSQSQLVSDQTSSCDTPSFKTPCSGTSSPVKSNLGGSSPTPSSDSPLYSRSSQPPGSASPTGSHSSGRTPSRSSPLGSEGENCQGGESSAANASMVAALAGQVALDIAAMDADYQAPPVSTSAAEQEAISHNVKDESVMDTTGTQLQEELMEADSQIVRTDTMEMESVNVREDLENESNVSAIETEHVQEAQNSMDEEDTNQTAEVGGEEDDLFIKEPSPDVEVSEDLDNPDTPAVEKMDSP